MTAQILLLLLIAPVWGDAAALPPLPVREAPTATDMDAKGYPDKVPFYQGKPVNIVRTGDTPEVTPVDIKANGVLVAPSYLAYLEKLAAWSAGADRYLQLTTADCTDQTARLEWMLTQKQAELDAERTPLPVLQRDWAKFAGGALVATGAILTAGWALGQLNQER